MRYFRSKKKAITFIISTSGFGSIKLPGHYNKSLSIIGLRLNSTYGGNTFSELEIIQPGNNWVPANSFQIGPQPIGILKQPAQPGYQSKLTSLKKSHLLRLLFW